MKNVHLGDTAVRKNSEYACGVSMLVSPYSTENRDCVTCPCCAAIVEKADAESMVEQLRMSNEQKKFEEKYYGKGN